MSKNQIKRERKRRFRMSERCVSNGVTYSREINLLVVLLALDQYRDYNWTKARCEMLKGIPILSKNDRLYRTSNIRHPLYADSQLMTTSDSRICLEGILSCQITRVSLGDATDGTFEKIICIFVSSFHIERYSILPFLQEDEEPKGKWP